MTTHIARAIKIFRDITRMTEVPLQTAQSARQGDLILVRRGDSTAIGELTRPGGIVLAAGMHGEHRLIADAATVTGDVVDLPYGGVVVHTDVPAGRHRSIRCAPGTWEILHQQEVTSDVVRRVQD